MLRIAVASATMALLAVTAGCTMCAHPYDDCGPTFTAEGCQRCMPNARAGSILSPGLQPIAGAEIGPETVPAPGAYRGTMLKGPNGRTVVRQMSSPPAETAAAARPQRTPAGPPRRVQ